jgi:hypothetical protein
MYNSCSSGPYLLQISVGPTNSMVDLQKRWIQINNCTRGLKKSISLCIIVSVGASFLFDISVS